MGFLTKVLRERKRGRRDFGPPMGGRRMFPAIPSPIPSSGRGGLKGVFDNIQEFIAQNPDKTRQGGGILGGVDLTGESLRNALPPVVGGPPLDTSLIPEREILQRPIIPPRRDDFMSIERIDKPINELIPRMPNETPIPFVPPVIPQTPISPPVNIGGPPLDTSLIPEREILQRPPSIGGIGGINQPLQPVLQQPQPIGIPSLMDPRQPQPNLATGIIDPVSQPIQQLPLGPQIIPQVPNPFEKPIMPPKRDDFMSIGGPGGGFTDNRVLEQQPFVPPQQPTFTPISERTDIYGAGKDYDPANLPEGYSFNNQGPPRLRTAVMPQPGFVYAYGPDGDRISVPSGAPGAEELRNQPPLSSILGDGMTSPGLIGQEIDTTPVLGAGDVRVPTDMGVTPPEPVTTIPQDTRGQVDPVLAQQDTREVLSDPLLRALYFGTADQPGFINQLQQATQNVMGAELPSAQFDPNMTQQFYNPYEDRVVQQTIQDVMEYGDKQDIAQRAEDIQQGGLSAFGSRARLTAGERQEALGRGLAEALSGIRSQGYTEAQRRALENYQNQYTRQLGQIDRPVGLLTSIGRSLPGYGAASTTIESDYRMPVDPSTAGLGAALSTYQAIKPPATQTG